MLLGLFKDIGLESPFPTVRPRPVYTSVTGGWLPLTGALSVIVETFSGSGCVLGSSSAIGDSGGGGILVPAVRLTGSIERAGSSNFPRLDCVVVLFSTLVGGMVSSVAV
jgi:hypothetical protein